jgi:hypothetical protein
MNAPLAALMLALVALIGLAAAWASPADAGLVPDTVQLAMMRQAVADVPMVRVRGVFGTRSGYRPSLDSSGVRLAETLEGPRHAMLTPATLAEPMSWHEITSLETEQPGSKGMGAMIGGLTGLAVGFAVVATYAIAAPFADQQQQAMTVLGVSVASGTVLGALIGRNGQRRMIYPPAAGGRRE